MYFMILDETPTVLSDINSTNNDFPCKAHCLVRWWVPVVIDILSFAFGPSWSLSYDN